MTDEKKLIERVLSGDAEAFSDLMALHEKQVYNLCLRMTGHQEDAKDLAQEAFIKAWRGLQFYKFESSFSTWLYRLTSNVCIDFLRQQKRRATDCLIMTDDNGEETELEIVDSAPLPEQQAEARENREQIASALLQLEEEFRLALTLRVVDELSYEEIAEVLNLKPGTVKSRIARARTKLKIILLQNGNFFCNDSSNSTERRAAP